MSAKEMFERLGYELNDYFDIDEEYKKDKYYAIYVYEIKGHGEIIKEIAFFPNTEKISLNAYTGEDNWSIEELQAINQQVLELGWNK